MYLRILFFQISYLKELCSLKLMLITIIYLYYKINNEKQRGLYFQIKMSKKNNKQLIELKCYSNFIW